jgi:NADH-quinone oxidoreductase subunit E
VEEVREQEIGSFVKNIIDKHGKSREALIRILSEVNEHEGHISANTLAEIRRQMQKPDEGVFLSDSQLYSLASFYKMLSLQPLGKHVIRFCESAPCHVMGGRQIKQVLQSELNIKPGETSPDGKWTLIAVSCFGLCSNGPVFFVDDDQYGNIAPDLVHDILERYH